VWLDVTGSIDRETGNMADRHTQKQTNKQRTQIYRQYAWQYELQISHANLRAADKNVISKDDLE